MTLKKFFLLLLQIFVWLVLMQLERSIGLPVLSTLVLLVFVSQFDEGLWIAMVGVAAGLVYAVTWGLPLGWGTLIIGSACYGFVATAHYFRNQNRRLLLTNLIVCLIWWWLTKQPLSVVAVGYHLTLFLIAVLGVYLISGWKLRRKTLQISRRLQF